MADRGKVLSANRENAVVAYPPVAMDLDAVATRAIATWLAQHRGQDMVGAMKDALWLRSLFLKHHVGLSRFERAAFRRRADRLLARLLE